MNLYTLDTVQKSQTKHKIFKMKKPYCFMKHLVLLFSAIFGIILLNSCTKSDAGSSICGTWIINSNSKHTIELSSAGTYKDIEHFDYGSRYTGADRYSNIVITGKWTYGNDILTLLKTHTTIYDGVGNEKKSTTSSITTSYAIISKSSSSMTLMSSNSGSTYVWERE